MSETVDSRRLTELRSLLRALEEAGWEYARVEIDGVTLVVSSDADFGAHADAGEGRPPAQAATRTNPIGAAPVTAAPEVSPPTVAEPAADGPVETVTSPTIGLFWRSPKPGAPPFVQVGDVVSAGDTVCIIEVMKLMTHVTAPVDGTVRAIRVENGGMVEQGTPLLDIEPAGARR